MAPEVIEYIAPQTISTPNRRQHACPEEEDAGLLQSMRAVKILQPIRVKRENGKIVAVSGHRRLAAAIKLNMPEVPVIFEQDSLTDSDIKIRRLFENLHRSDLNPFEKASSIHELIQAKRWSSTQASSELGISASSISRLLSLLELPPAIGDKVANGEIPLSAAYELAQIGDAARQTELAQQVVAGTITRDGLTAARKTKATGSASPSNAKPTRVVAMLGAQRSVAVSAVGLTLEVFIEQVEELLSKARKVRTQGVELSTFIKMLADQAKA